MSGYILTLDEAQALLAKRDAEIECLRAEHKSLGAHLAHLGANNDKLRADKAELLTALKPIVLFCDDPNGSERPESLAMGLARLLPAARTAIAKVSK